MTVALVLVEGHTYFPKTRASLVFVERHAHFPKTIQAGSWRKKMPEPLTKPNRKLEKKAKEESSSQ